LVQTFFLRNSALYASLLQLLLLWFGCFFRLQCSVAKQTDVFN
jgi:hypothetical protein